MPPVVVVLALLAVAVLSVSKIFHFISLLFVFVCVNNLHYKIAKC